MKNILTSIANSTPVNGQGYVPTEDLEHTISQMSSNSVLWASLILAVLLIIGALTRERVPKLKAPIFILSSINVIAVTLFLIGSTVYLNVNSSSGGPVHWHADLEIWACDQELELRDPTGRLSNKIGTATLHEHNDTRIHLEGVVVEERDASLGKFFYVIDGNLTDSNVVVPVNGADNGDYFEDDTEATIDTATQKYIVDNYIDAGDEGDFATFIDGQTCPNGEQAEVQTFVYSVAKDSNGNIRKVTVDGVEKTVYTQRKLDNPQDYVITDESIVPPGDCVIVEFAPTKDYTDKICFQYIVQTEELESYYYEVPAPTQEEAPETDGSEIDA